jgi:hypothetical protein
MIVGTHHSNRPYHGEPSSRTYRTRHVRDEQLHWNPQRHLASSPDDFEKSNDWPDEPSSLPTAIVDKAVYA